VRKLFYIFFLVCCFATNDIVSQSIATEFGKNRVQYHDDYHKWWMYETENFITYWYGKGKNIGQFVVQMAEYEHKDIQNLMEHRINDKIEIIVYLDQSDLKQSNIGTSETFESSHGKTTIIGNKMFVYFDGNHRNLRNQIRKGIANAYLNAMYAQSNLQEIVQNSLSLNLDEWYAQGIVNYAASDWEYLIEDELRDLWSQKRPNYRKFDKIARLRPKVAGHSFWYFIDQEYGKSTVSNMLYLTRLNRNLDNSFMFVLGKPLDQIKEEWTAFYNELFERESEIFEDVALSTELNLSNKDHVPISVLRLSPDGSQLAYAYNDIGKVWVKLYNFDSGKEQLIFKSGYRNNVQEPDFSYPLIAWHPSGQELTLVYEHRDKIHIRKIDIQTGEEADQTLPEDIQRVYNISYKNDLDYILSASTDGYSNIHIYYSKGRQHEKLTDDFYDDIDANYVSKDGTKGILFSSNRPGPTNERLTMDTIMPVDFYDIYFIPLDEKVGKMIQLTNSPAENERYPFLSESGKISFLAYSSGMKNRHVFDAQNGSSYPNSNKPRNIIRHHSIANNNKYVYTLYDDQAYRAYVEYPNWNQNIVPAQLSNAFARHTLKTEESLENTTIGILKPVDQPEEMQEGYLFQSLFDDPETIPTIDVKTPETKVARSAAENYNVASNADIDQSEIIEFVSARAVASRSKFKLESFTTNMDNGVLFEGLDSYTDDQSQIQNQPFGLLLKGVVKDLFEDYTITAGMRIPTSLNGLENFLIFDDNRGLIDKRFALYRRTETNTEANFIFPSQRTKSSSLLGLYRLKYPLDVYTSIRATAQLRFDRQFFLHSDEFSSNQLDDFEKRISLKAEYVFDNTIPVDDNVLWGTRYKGYLELINRFDINTQDGFNFDPSRGFTAILGFDARHYIPILNHSILALRGAGATSFGSDKMLYYVGGVENWLFSQTNQEIGVPPGKTFAYQVVAPHLRGFRTNIRNGSTFLLTNTELRLPLFKYFSQRRIRSSFLRNFMLVGFFDMGTAWHGLKPSSDENPINTATIEQPPVLRIDIQYFRDPLVFGYGAGLRTSLLGYHIRVDYAWGVESRSVLEPRIYFAFGKDF